MKNKLVGLALTGILAISSGCHRHAPNLALVQYPSYSSPVSQQVPQQPVVIPQTISEPPRRVAQGRLGLQIFIENHPNFKTLTEFNFRAAQVVGGQIQFNNPNFTYYSGQKFVTSALFTHEVYGMQCHYEALSPSGQLVRWANIIPDDQDNQALSPVYDVDEMIQKVGPGNYTFNWYFDGKKACSQGVRVSDTFP